MKYLNKIMSLLILTLFVTLISCNKKVKFNVSFYIDNEVYEVVGTNGTEEIAMPVDPIKEGYIFDGWYWDQGTWLKPFSANSLLDIKLKENMNVYAYFIGEDDPVGTDLKFKDGTIVSSNSIGDTYLIKVSNSTIVFPFSDYVHVSNTATWTVSTDVSGNNIITSKTVELEVGNNIYFIQVTDTETNKVKQYNIAVRRRPMYIVNFNTNGGSICLPQKVEEDSFITVPTTTKKGYTFNKWSYDMSNPVVENLTIIAYWTPNTYNITFDSNGGTISSNSMSVTYNTNVTLPTPIRKGYTFNGWYKDNTKYNSGIWTQDENINLVANWTPNTYNISYDLDGGNLSNNKPTSYTVGNTYHITNPTKVGYEFTGWYVNDSNNKIKDYVINNSTCGDITLTANYKPKTYIISFDLDGGTGVNDTLEVIYDDEYILPTPTKQGYTFMGWYNGSTKVTSGIWQKTSSLDLKAKWTIANYNINYVLNGGVNNTDNPATYTYLTDTIILKDPSKIGYTFNGWTTDTITSPAKNLEIAKGSYNDKTFIANFTANSYNVTFNVNGGNNLEISNYIYVYDTYYNLPVPTRTGYKFVGWYDGTINVIDGNWKLTKDVELVAKWEIITYNINYILNNGINNNSNIIKYNYEYEDILIEDPYKTGYTFNGWTTDTITTPVKNYVIPHNSTGHITLIANFTPNTYTYILDVNSGDALEKTEFNINYDDAYTLPIPTRTGYEFLGWYNGTTKVNSGTWKYTENIILIAKWNIITYTISYTLNNGTNNSYNPSSYNYENDDIVIYEPKRTGYTFLGWTINNALVPVKEFTILHNTTGNYNFVANWQINTYYITYDVNGGDNLENDTVGIVYNNSYSLPTPTRTGYTFQGWYNGSTKINSGTYTYTTDLTLVAKWAIINYAINYNLDDGINNINNPSTYTYESDDITIKEPTKEGYTFIGWTTPTNSVPTKEVTILHNTTGELTFVANWEANIYTVTLDVNGGEDLTVISYDIEYDSVYELPIPIRIDNSFKGWYDNNQLVSTNGIWNKSSDVYLVARWIGPYVEDGITYINIGRYPQTVVTDTTIITNLNTITETNELGYIEYNSEEYKKSVASPYASSYRFINGNAITSGETYYFKVEPIKWRVLYNSDGTYKLLSEMILDNSCYFNHIYDRNKIYANNYQYSNIRAWLNGYNGTSYSVDNYANKGFYDIAFIEVEKILINSTLVDNNTSNDTTDKIYLLSIGEVLESSYGFNNDTNRQTQISDYARSNGCKMISSGNGIWWTRTGNAYNYQSRYVFYDGSINDDDGIYYVIDVDRKYCGIRPALEITI